MKKSAALFLMLIAVSISCKKSETDDNNPSGDGKNCKLLTASATINGFTSSSLLYYDDSGNLLYIKDVYSPGDTITDMQFKYTGNILQYSCSSGSADFSDTTFYFYDVDNKLESTVEHNRAGSFLMTTKTDYFYNTANQAVHTVSRATTDLVNFLVDSIFYSYTGKNVTSVIQFSRSGSGPWYSFTMNISYDNMKSYTKSMGMPPTTYFYWSENNITKIMYADSTDAMTTIDYSKYNESGYPTELTAINHMPQHDTITEILTYQCK
jgi:hypothetical protein